MHEESHIAQSPALKYTLPVPLSRLSRPLFVVPIKVRQVLPLVAVVLILLITFAPLLLTATWHVLHGRSMTYKNRKIPVPMRWNAKSEPRGVQIEKLASNILLTDNPVLAIISFSTNPSTGTQTHKEALKSFEDVYWTYRAGNRVVTGPVKVLSGPDEGVCMEAAAKNGPERLEIACLVFRDEWTV